jgi:PhzF family phenazine biosynthesis protein
MRYKRRCPMRFRFRQVDVFTDETFRGDPVAVVSGADRLRDSEMRAITAWRNLSETTFVQASRAADYRLSVDTNGLAVFVGGHCRTAIDGQIRTPSARNRGC